MSRNSFCETFDLTAPHAAALYDETMGHGFVTDENTAAQARLQVLELNSGFAPVWWYAGSKAPLTAVAATPAGCRAVPGKGLRPEELACRRLPLTYKIKVPAAGSYQVTVTLAAAPDAPETEPKEAEPVLLFLGRRRLCWKGRLTREQPFTGSFVADVTPIIPRGQDLPAVDDSVDVTVVGSHACLQAIHIEAAPGCRTIFILGDSTVTDQSADTPYAPGTSYAGWGQMLPVFLPGYNISNHAHSGLTTESFRTEGHYDILRRLVKPGDICLMQFGHNDQKLANLKADEGYTRRLADYTAELRALGATPVVVTPLARNSWSAVGQYNDLLAGYAAACHALGEALALPVIDLHAKAMAEIERVGVEGAKIWFYPGDYTHTNDYGAYKMAAYVADGLRAAGLVGQTADPAPVCCTEWLPRPPFAPLTPPAGITIAPPEGTGDPFAAYDTTRPDAPLTRVEALAITIQAMHFFPTNVYNDLYADVVGHETYAGTVQCAAQNGLVPAAFVADGNLYPDRPVTLAEFLMVLMPGYRSRRAVPALADAAVLAAAQPPIPEAAAPAVAQALAAGLLPADSAWNEKITRRRAGALCRGLKI